MLPVSFEFCEAGYCIRVIFWCDYWRKNWLLAFSQSSYSEVLAATVADTDGCKRKAVLEQPHRSIIFILLWVHESGFVKQWFSRVSLEQFRYIWYLTYQLYNICLDVAKQNSIYRNSYDSVTAKKTTWFFRTGIFLCFTAHYKKGSETGWGLLLPTSKWEDACLQANFGRASTFVWNESMRV